MNYALMVLVSSLITGCIVTHSPDPEPVPITPAVEVQVQPDPSPPPNDPIVAPTPPVVVTPSPITPPLPTPSPPCTQSPGPSPLCKAMFRTVYAAAEMVADSLGCIDLAAVAADVGLTLSKLDMCRTGTTKKAVLGATVCYALSEYVAEYAVKKLPITWQCSGGYATAYARKQMLDACYIAFPY